MTIASVASQFMQTSKGLSPAQGAARGYKSGIALGQRNRALDQEQQKIDQTVAAGNRRSQKEMEEELRQKRLSMGTSLIMRAKKNPKAFGTELSALKKAAPEVFPAEVNTSNFETFMIENDTKGDWAKAMRGFAEDEKKAREEGRDIAAAGLAQDKYGLEQQKFAEQQRSNRAKEQISRDKGGLSLSVGPEGEVSFSTDGKNVETPTGAKTALFKDITAGQQAIDSINQIETLYDPSFLSYAGAAKGWLATKMNKMDPNVRSGFQQRRAAFLSAANKEFLRFRKWATGVAGGEKEMAEIKRATFSEDDSSQDFEAKLNLARGLQRRLNARSKAALSAGINNQKEFEGYIKANPLSGIPSLQERGDALEGQGYSEQTIMEILTQEGYIEPR